MGFSYNAGTLAVEEHVGTREEAAGILTNGWVSSHLSSSGDVQMHELETREIYMTSLDDQGNIWTSPINGANPGFLDFSPSDSDDIPEIFHVSSGRRGFLTFEGDPLLANISRPNAPVGILLMSHKYIRRYRINGRVSKLLTSNDGGSVAGLDLAVTMAMGNCPKYVHKKNLVSLETMQQHPVVKRSAELTPRQMRWIANADGFVLGTFAPPDSKGTGGADASNRGGNPGFIAVTGPKSLSFPDFVGNNIFLSLGNIHSYGRAAMLFIDRDNGNVLQVSVAARIVWQSDAVGAPRRVECSVLAVNEATSASPLRYRTVQLSPFSPPAVPQPLPAAAELEILDSAENSVSENSALTAAVGGVSGGLRRLRVVCVTPEAVAVKTIRFEAADGGLLQYTPGQYATFLFSAEALAAGRLEPPQPNSAEEPIVRNWTITSAPRTTTQTSSNNGSNASSSSNEASSSNAGDKNSTAAEEVPEEHRYLEITVKLVPCGRVSPLLHAWLQPGMEVAFAGASGDFTLLGQVLNAESGPGTTLTVSQPKRRKLLFLSAGIGITPMVANLRWLSAKLQEIQKKASESEFPVGDALLLHATRSAADVPFLKELADLASRSSGRVTARLALTGATDASTSAEAEAGGLACVAGRPTFEMLQQLVPDLSERLVFLCGPKEFMVGMEKALAALGVPAADIRTEEFYF